MTVLELKNKLKLDILVGGEGLENEVTGCYIGDLLSWVMGRAKSGDAWLTVMGNINAIAVAVLADASCIILCENAALDDEAKKKAEQQGVTILTGKENSYQMSVKIYTALENK